MNKFIGLGNITRDPELKYSKAGTAVVKFGIAINDGWGDKKQTSFLNCVAFSKMAETIHKFTGKGSKVLIEAKVQTGSYDKKDGSGKVYTTDFIIDKVEFLSSKKDNQSNDYNQGFGNPMDDFTPINDLDGDLPF